MAASRQTVEGVLRILTEELGRKRAHEIVLRIKEEVAGNASFVTTVGALERSLRYRKSEPEDGR